MKATVSGLELTIENAGQILNMGGPWIGNVWLGAYFISHDCIVDNFVYLKESGCIFFVKYHLVSKYSWYFTLNFYNVNTKSIYEFKLVFNMVYLGEFVAKNKLKIYNAFHGRFENTSLILDLDEEEF